jgi:hypothetical protein
VARGQRPARPGLDQRERLAVLVEMNSGGSLHVLDHDHRPVAERHVFEPRERVHRRIHAPDVLEIA